MILNRLKKELARTGDLSERQFGFRERKQPTDALVEVLKKAEEAQDFSAAHRRLCAVITLDVKNAINSASWQVILESLRQRKIDEGLIAFLASYLKDRKLIIEAEGETQEIPLSSGVPQGSILGPTLWNISYDSLLRMEMPVGISLIGFADDIAMTIVEKDEKILMNKANTGLQRISNWMESKLLKFAPQKTEAIILTTKRKLKPICFSIESVDIIPSKAIKYLGVWLDPKLKFTEHIIRTIQKSGKTLTALSCIMPNIGGPRSSKRKILGSVIHSQILYAAPFWHTVTSNKSRTKKLAGIQRLTSIRIASAYRTISTEAVGVIAGVPPIDLLIEERKEIYNGVQKQIARGDLLDKWQESWVRGTNGRWTYNLIPDIRQWISNPCGETDYFVTQALSGHGCFMKYLTERKKRDSDSCNYCGNSDDAEHTLFRCTRWDYIRSDYKTHTGSVFNAENMMKYLTGTEEMWKLTAGILRQILEEKENYIRRQ